MKVTIGTTFKHENERSRPTAVMQYMCTALHHMTRHMKNTMTLLISNVKSNCIKNLKATVE